MFGRSRVMHIPDADDELLAAFEAHVVHELVALCGAVIARPRGWFPSIGGAREDAPTCTPCALEDGNYVWDEETQNWHWAGQEVHQ